MNDSLRRTLALIVAGAAVWGIWYGWQSWKTRQALEALENVVRSADLNKLLSDPPEDGPELCSPRKVPPSGAEPLGIVYAAGWSGASNLQKNCREPLDKKAELA